MASRRTRVALTIAGIVFVVLFGLQIPACMMANTPKTGHVVDAASGKPMAGVAVIASAKFAAQNLIHGTNASCRYLIVTHTDADGGYYIPNTWSRIAFGLPGTDPRLNWVVTAFKPGYAIEGDEAAWTFDEYGAAKEWPASVIQPPPAWWLGVVVRVNPIRMKPVQLGVKEATVYYRNILTAGACSIIAPPRAEETALWKAGYDLLLPQVCAMPPETMMDQTEALSLVLDYTKDRVAAGKRIEELEPENRNKDSYMHPAYRAGDVCDAMKLGGAP